MLFIIFKFFGHYTIKLNNSNCKRFGYFLVPVSQGNLGYACNFGNLALGFSFSKQGCADI